MLIPSHCLPPGKEWKIFFMWSTNSPSSFSEKAFPSVYIRSFLNLDSMRQLCQSGHTRVSLFVLGLAEMKLTLSTAACRVLCWRLWLAILVQTCILPIADQSLHTIKAFSLSHSGPALVPKKWSWG